MQKPRQIKGRLSMSQHLFVLDKEALSLEEVKFLAQIEKNYQLLTSNK